MWNSHCTSSAPRVQCLDQAFDTSTTRGSSGLPQTKPMAASESISPMKLMACNKVCNRFVASLNMKIPCQRTTCRPSISHSSAIGAAVEVSPHFCPSPCALFVLKDVAVHMAAPKQEHIIVVSHGAVHQALRIQPCTLCLCLESKNQAQVPGLGCRAVCLVCVHSASREAITWRRDVCAKYVCTVQGGSWEVAEARI